MMLRKIARLNKKASAPENNNFYLRDIFSNFALNEFCKYINNNLFDSDNNSDMLSKNKASFIASLQRKKIREDEQLYVVEGDKIVKEYLTAGAPVKILVANPLFINSLNSSLKNRIEEIIPSSYEELKKISTLKTPHNALAVVKIPEYNRIINLSGTLCAALDFVQDPGNLGTIIRAAAWFGIKEIYCSENCVDIFNPKTVQASMGAILHVKVAFTDLEKILDQARSKKISVYGATLDGESIYDTELAKEGIILLGNESKGISAKLSEYVTHKIKIPFFGEKNSEGIDSLNVSMAASVIFSEFSRR